MYVVAELETHMPARIEVDTSKFILSPMPGAIVSINVAEGDHVVEGQEVAVIEAMKMQNVRKADIKFSRVAWHVAVRSSSGVCPHSVCACVVLLHI